MRGVQLNSNRRRIFIVSLDGATFAVLRPLLEQGYLPNIKSQMEMSLASELESVIPPVTAAAWTSFMTGKHPGKHGILGFTNYSFDTHRDQLNNARDIRSKTLWQILSEKDKRVIVLQLPFTFPPYPINGIMVSGWDMPSTASQFTFPAEVRAEVQQVVPDFASTLDLSLWDHASIRMESEFKSFVEKLVRAFEQATQLALHFLQKEADWDVFMVHFQQTDFIQHKLWRYIETACQDPSNKESRVEEVRRCYRKFDAMVGTLLSQVETVNPIKIILSDHGFGDYKGAICPNYYLHEWGYLHLVAQDEGNIGRVKDIFRKSRFKAVRKFYDRLYKLKSGFFARRELKKYKTWTDLAEDTFPNTRTHVDWSKTKAATLEANQVAFIYINSAGRGPFGLVQPGAERERIVADIMARMGDLRHPVTGEKLIADVLLGGDVYPGSVDGVEVPDLILIPADGYGFSTAVKDTPPQLLTEGLHRPNGILLIQGDGLNRTAQDFHPRLIDVAPTILHMLGLPVPQDMDGRVLEEVFPAWQEVRSEAVDNTLAHQEAAVYNAVETQLIEDRLKGLGYIE